MLVGVRIARITIPDFPVQVEIKHDPSLRHKPVIIGGSPHQGGKVFARSPAAHTAGIELGMQLRQAEQLASEAIFLPINGELYGKEHEALIGCLSAFSPLRETISLGEIYLEASGLEGLYGPDRILIERICADIKEQTSFLARIGLASNKFTASIAALLSPLNSGEVVKNGEEAKYLAPLPIEVLSISDASYHLLLRLGLHIVGQVAAMPPGALSRTLGKEGEALNQLSQGIDERPLIPEFEGIPLSAQLHLDFELQHLPALVAYTDLLITQLVRELGGYGAGVIILEFEQEDGKQRLMWGAMSPPSSDRSRLADRASRMMERTAFTAGVTSLKISLAELKPSHEDSRQLPFHQRYAMTPDPLGKSIRRIRERFGKAAIKEAVAISGPPPQRIEVHTTEAGVPTALFRDRKWSSIEAIQLHWRVEGDWWWNEGRKDYYQAITKDGEIMVLLHTTPQGQWFLHPAAKPTRWPVI